MSKEKQIKQAMAFRRFQMFLKEFHDEVRDLVNENPNDLVSKELMEFHNRCCIELVKSVQKVLKDAERNFLRVVEDETDPS